MTKQMGEHTKGPWSVHWTGRNAISSGKPSVASGDIPSVISDEHHIAQMYVNKNGYSHIEANARLIAAAPELLEAIRAMIDMATDNRTHGPEIDKACEALAKAEGRHVEPKKEGRL